MTASRRPIRPRRAYPRSFAGLVTCLAIALLAPSFGGMTSANPEVTEPERATSNGLAGQLLVAAPGMRDPRFIKTVIYMVHHDRGGAMGLVLNRQAGVHKASELLDQLWGNDHPGDSDRSVRIHYGGPVQPSLGIFIHSNDYSGRGTKTVTGRVSVTGGREVLRAIVKGKGPAKGFLAMGYAGWGPGQLENELRREDWITVPSDDELLFDGDMTSKWRRAMDKQSIDL